MPPKFAVAAIVLTALASPSSAESTLSEAILVTPTGVHKLEVELADSPKERGVGLMDRKSMPADQGMLFRFNETRPVTMWMKNTLIPLDMLFLNEKGVVTHLKERAEPESLALIASGGPVRYVLELNGGAIARYGIRVGSELRHSSITAGK